MKQERKKHKVLIIEDDPAVAKRMQEFVEKAGYHVNLAENGSEGIEKFKKDFHEIVVTDLKIPGFDGLEVIDRIRNHSKNTQIIVITGFGDKESAVSALRKGVLDYIKKPIDLKQLLLALGRASEKIDEYNKVTTSTTLLIAEDEDVPRNRIARLMEKEGCVVHTAADGEEALKIFGHNKIDIVLLDIKMPKKDGLTALHEMRSESNDFEAIVLTGHGDEDSAIQAMRDGAANFLKKPVDLDELILSIKKAKEQLNSRRLLNYRTRELALAKKMIEDITTDKKLVAAFEKSARIRSNELNTVFLDFLPLGIVVLYENGVKYVNRFLTEHLNYTPKAIDETFLKNLLKIGIQGLSIEGFLSDIKEVMESPAGTVKNLDLGEDSTISMISSLVSDSDEEKNAVFMVIQNKRI